MRQWIATHVSRKRLMVIAAFLLALVFIWLGSSVAVAYRLTRRAHAPFAEPAPTVPWGQVESVRLTTSDGQQLGAWFVAGPEDGPSVVVLHGNGKCRTDYLPVVEMLARNGCSVLAVSLRAHGDSTGEYNDLGYSARHDVVAAVEFLERRRPGRPIIIQGTSLGAAAAIYAAGDLGERVSGYVLECPYRDVRTAVRNRTSAFLPVVLDRVAYAGLALVGPLFLPDIDRMAPVDRIGDIPPGVPVLLLVGKQDDRARPEEVEEMYGRVSSHARLVVLDGAGHELCGLCDTDPYREAVLGFIAEASRRKR